MITAALLGAICPRTPAALLVRIADPLREAAQEFLIDGIRLREAHFLAQLAQESGGFHYIRELATGDAYEGREDLGNDQPGDGRRFKGWGWIQTTGRRNTQLVSHDLFGDDRLVIDPTLIDPPNFVLAARAAGHFWTKGAGLNLSKRAKAHGIPVGVNLNDLADQDDGEGITLAVNGGLNGLDQRLAYLTTAKENIA